MVILSYKSALIISVLGSHNEIYNATGQLVERQLFVRQTGFCNRTRHAKNCATLLVLSQNMRTLGLHRRKAVRTV